MISHMRGHTSDMDAIMALCDARGIPVVEDAAHSLGTNGGAQDRHHRQDRLLFSFQSYKLVNAGEGGILVTDDPELAARCVIMSGAYESNWKKHPGMQNSYMLWQNKLPLYNMRMQNLSAAVIRPQLPLVAERVQKGRAGHDWVAAAVNRCAGLSVPAALPGEDRAPDSIQFNLVGALVGCAGAGVSGRSQGARRSGSGLWPVGGQRACLLELGVPWPSAGFAPDPRHVDAGL
jgi:perosamine synthetase